MAGNGAAGEEKKAPRIWALLGGRAGDDAQVQALAAMIAERTGAIVTEKPLRYRLLRNLPNWLIGAAAPLVLTRESIQQLAPPWPDLIIGVGRRSVPAGLWIRRMARTRPVRLVWLGRPRAPLAWFDMVLTTAQYGLPEEGPVILLDLPPARAAAVEDAYLARWRARLADLPRPLTAVLVGGARWPVLFDADDAQRLGRAVLAERERTGGAWVVSCSPRTGIRQARALHETLEKPGYFYFWRDGRRPEDNPHRALLALADRFIVTSDSASMIAEAVRTGKPVRLWPMRESRLALHWSANAGLARWLAVRGLLTPPRNMRAFCDRLKAQGLVSFIGEAEPEDHLCAELREKALDAALARIERWLSP